MVIQASGLSEEADMQMEGDQSNALEHKYVPDLVEEKS